MTAAIVLAAGCTATYEASPPRSTTTSLRLPGAASAPRAVVTTVPSGAAAPATSVPRLAARPVTGRILRADGTPLGGAPVRLDENRSVANDVLGGVFFLLTAGLSCIAGADPCRPSGGASATTGADGEFRFDVEAVERARGGSNGVILSAGAAPTGGLRAKFDPAVGGDLGELALWSPNLRAGTDGFHVRFKATAPPGADGRTEVDARVLDGQGRAVVDDTETGTDVTFAVDRRAYEDGPGTVVLASGFSRPRAAQNPRIDWTSPPARVGSGAGAPLSRGRPCTMDVGGRVPPAGCPLTDGDLVTESVPGLRSVVVDLGASRPVGLIAVRRLAETVEISDDGQAYVPVARTSGQGGWPATRHDAGGRPGRFVRVVVAPPETREPTGAAEVSVWAADAKPATSEPEPAGAPATAGTIPDGGPAPMAPPLDVDGERSSAVTLAGTIAAGLLLSVAFAAGITLYRRRRT